MSDILLKLATFHFSCSTLCIASILTVFTVTTSYVSQAMMELDAAAKEAGIVVMNEIGLDPGIGMSTKICMKMM